MWCHLCKKEFLNQEDFKWHILKRHRPDSGYYRGSDSEEDEEETEEQNAEEVSQTADLDLEVSSNDESVASSEAAAQHSPDASFDEPELSSPTMQPENPNTTVGSRRSTQKKIYTSEEEDDFDDDEEEEDNQEVNSKLKVNNSYIVNPLCQSVNQPFSQPPTIVINSSAQPNGTSGGFPLDSKNVLEWLSKHKELCRNIKYPLPQSLFNKIKLAHTEIISRFCMATPNEVNPAMLKVCDDLNNMILKHISAVHEKLSA